MQKLVLKSPLPPGDILMLTAAVRDLHRNHPGKFLTDVRTRFPDLWRHNPLLSTIPDDDPEAVRIDCHYPLIGQANRIPRHFLEGYTDFLSEKLNLRISPTEFRGDIYLSDEERREASPLRELFGYDGPYWLVAAGGKRDFTIKWWDHRRYQQVVDHFRGRMRFAQVGASGDFHPELAGVFDFRTRTDLRQLIRLVYHASGILCSVTFLMHLAAAVPTRKQRRLRPCVVVAGRREAPHWEAYPGHQFIHTIGMLPCCRHGGCWRVRTKPLPGRSPFNDPDLLCLDVVDDLPRCMEMIRADDVIRRIEMFLSGEGLFRTAAEHTVREPTGKPANERDETTTHPA